VSDVTDGDASGTEAEPHAVRRAVELLVFAPVGVALTVVEDLPGLISKGRQRFQTDVRNARVIGQFVVGHGRREVVTRMGQLLHEGAPEDLAEEPEREAEEPESDSEFENETAIGDTAGGRTATGPGRDTAAQGEPFTPPAPPKPEPDPADAIIVESALAGYDTLSASQVVRRLESLGPDELRAVLSHEASHRNRRTILNRAQQLLDAGGSDGPAEPDRPVA
jgi:hypothetical protein